MLPAIDDINLYRGDSVRLVRTLKTADENDTLTPYVLTGCIPKAEIRTAEAPAEVLVEFTATLANQVTDPGTVYLVIEAGVTDTFPSTARWDFQLTHPDGTVRTYCQGKVSAQGQVTL